MAGRHGHEFRRNVHASTRFVRDEQRASVNVSIVAVSVCPVPPSADCPALPLSRPGGMTRDISHNLTEDLIHWDMHPIRTVVSKSSSSSSSWSECRIHTSECPHNRQRRMDMDTVGGDRKASAATRSLSFI